MLGDSRKSNDENKCQNNQVQNSSEKTADNPDRDNEMVLSITQKYENTDKFSPLANSKIISRSNME